MNASDMMPAVISAIAVPLKGHGISAASSRSRIDANMTSTSAKPAAAPKAEKYGLHKALGLLHVQQRDAKNCAVGGDQRNVDAEHLVQQWAQSAHHDLGELHAGCDHKYEANRPQVFEFKRQQDVFVQQVGAGG